MSSTAAGVPAPAHQTPLLKLTGPIWVENMLRITIQSVDVFMLSFWSEKAVAAVGLTNQFVFFIQLVYMMVIIGASILISQNLGAGRRRTAGLAGVGSLVLVGIMACAMSAVTIAVVGPLVSLYSLEPEVHDYAVSFLAIVGGGSVFTAFGMALGGILRSHGHSRLPMYVNIGANLLNIIGNAFFIFGWLGVPRLGVTGVAISTVASQAAACVAMYLLLRSLRREIRMKYRDLRRVPRAIYRKILQVGVPTAGENLSYNIAQIVIMGFIASLGTATMAAYVFAITLLRYVFMSSIAIGNGTQIKVGYLVGAREFDAAYRKVLGYFAAGFAISFVLVLGLNLGKGLLLPLFTRDAAVIAIATQALLVSLVLEPGRNFNVIIIPALKGAGDVRFPVAMGMVFNWVCGVAGAWFFSIRLGLGLTGIFIGLALDEWIRGLIILFRWRSGAWRAKSLV
jgi:putative MATE family efflux protein